MNTAFSIKNKWTNTFKCISIDRICIVVRAGGTDHLLAEPGVSSGTGLSQFVAIKDVLEDFDIAENEHMMCFDTRASNTGMIRGAFYRFLNTFKSW